MKNVCVIFTSTIRPTENQRLLTFDERRRENEYVAAIGENHRRIAAKRLPLRLVVVENSGAPAAALTAHCQQLGIDFVRATPIPPEAFRGKGQGEARMLQRVIEHLDPSSASETIFLKVTGRLILTNLASIAKAVSRSPHDCLANLFVRGTYADTRAMAFTQPFWNEVMKRETELDDQSRRFLENIVADVVRDAATRNLTAAYLLPPPHFRGYSATTGEKYGSPLKYLIEAQKIYLRAWWKKLAAR